jgi:hypothetical protein
VLEGGACSHMVQEPRLPKMSQVLAQEDSYEARCPGACPLQPQSEAAITDL